MPKPTPTPAGATTTLAVGTRREASTATLTHVLGLLTLFLGPLILYFAFRGRASPWLRAHLVEAVNYHLLLVASFLLLIGVAVLFTAVNLATLALVAFLLLGVVILAHLVFGVIAIVQAARGRAYHFPLDIRLVR